jgi:hypothetical protein
MLYQEFTIPEYKWKVYAFYDTTFEDCEDVMDCLYSLGCGGESAQKAFRNLSSNDMNTGLTFSKDRKTCVVLGRATDRANFAHTYMHEIYHIGQHIANEYNIGCQGEPMAYIIGNLAAEMLPYASKFLCDCCANKYNHSNHNHYGREN